jgi:hypothetical protein
MANKKGRRRRFGSVRQLPSGRHQARYRGPDRLMRSAPATFDTETDANVWLTVTEAQIIRGDWIDPDAGRVPLGEYSATWIAERRWLPPPWHATRRRYAGRSSRGSVGSIWWT